MATRVTTDDRSTNRVALSRYCLGRFLLVIALIPLGWVAWRLAELPGPAMTSAFSDSGNRLLTATFRSAARMAENDRNDFRLLQLDSGQTLRATGTYAVLSGDDLAVFDLSSKTAVDVWTLDESSFQLVRRGSFPKQEIEAMAYAAPGYVASIVDARWFRITNIDTGQSAEFSLLPSPSSQTHFWVVRSTNSPTRWVVSEVTDRAAGASQHYLFAYEQGKIRQVAEWMASQSAIVVGDRVVSWTEDYLLETRLLADGSLIDSQSLADELGITPGSLGFLRFGQSPDLVGVYLVPMSWGVVDASRRQVLARFTADSGRLLDLHCDFALFLHRGERTVLHTIVPTGTVEIRRLSDQATVRKLDFDTHVEGAKLLNGSQVAVLFEDDSVRIYDIARGDLLRTFRDRSWLLPTVTLLALAYVAWSGLWVWVSLRRGTHVFWDILAVEGVLVAGLLLRLFLYIGPFRTSSFETVVCESLAASWVAVSVGWSLFGGRRWLVRAAGLLLGGTVALLLILALFGQIEEGIAIASTTGLLIVVLVAAVFLLLRRRGYRLVNTTDSGDSGIAVPVRSQFPLRDVFMLTAAVAFLLAFVRLVPLQHLSTNYVDLVLALAASFSGSAVPAWIGTLSPRHWLARLAAVALAVLLLGVGPLAVCPPPANPPSDMSLELIALPSAVAAAVWLPCWLCRLRGWQFLRVA